jgi:hypothetical protein
MVRLIVEQFVVPCCTKRIDKILYIISIKRNDHMSDMQNSLVKCTTQGSRNYINSKYNILHNDITSDSTHFEVYTVLRFSVLSSGSVRQSVSTILNLLFTIFNRLISLMLKFRLLMVLSPVPGVVKFRHVEGVGWRKSIYIWRGQRTHVHSSGGGGRIATIATVVVRVARRSTLLQKVLSET